MSSSKSNTKNKLNSNSQDLNLTIPEIRYVRCEKSHAIEVGQAHCSYCGRPPINEEKMNNLNTPEIKYLRCSKSHAIEIGKPQCSVCGEPPVVENSKIGFHGRGRGRPTKQIQTWSLDYFRKEFRKKEEPVEKKLDLFESQRKVHEDFLQSTGNIFLNTSDSSVMGYDVEKSNLVKQEEPLKKNVDSDGVKSIEICKTHDHPYVPYRSVRSDAKKSNLVEITKLEPDEITQKELPDISMMDFDDYLDYGLRKCTENHYYSANYNRCYECGGSPIDKYEEIQIQYILNKEFEKVDLENKKKEYKDEFGLLTCINGHVFPKSLDNCNICEMQNRSSDSSDHEEDNTKDRDFNTLLSTKPSLITLGCFHTNEPEFSRGGWNSHSSNSSGLPHEILPFNPGRGRGHGHLMKPPVKNVSCGCRCSSPSKMESSDPSKLPPLTRRMPLPKAIQFEDNEGPDFEYLRKKFENF